MSSRLPAVIIGAGVLVLILLLGGVRKAGILRLPESPMPSSSIPGEPLPSSSPSAGGVSENIRNVSLAADTAVASPLRVTGEARRYFFEGSFPVTVSDAEGRRVGGGLAQPAPGYDWMTADFVPFVAEVTFTVPTTETGVLTLTKDNPSGLPEHDEEVSIPIRFVTSDAQGCRPTGCSGQICADKDMASTCEFRADYACYRTALCARQANGKCGWTATPALAACLKNPPALE